MSSCVAVSKVARAVSAACLGVSSPRRSRMTTLKLAVIFQVDASDISTTSRGSVSSIKDRRKKRSMSRMSSYSMKTTKSSWKAQLRPITTNLMKPMLSKLHRAGKRWSKVSGRPLHTRKTEVAQRSVRRKKVKRRSARLSFPYRSCFAKMSNHWSPKGDKQRNRSKRKRQRMMNSKLSLKSNWQPRSDRRNPLLLRSPK